MKLNVVQINTHRINPRLVRLGVGVGIFDFLVIDDAPGFEVDQEHLARLQAPFLDDSGFGNRQHTGFGCHHHQVVVRYDIARGTQTIAIQRATDATTIGERHRGRAIPRFHHRGVVFVKGAAVVVHQRVIFPGFGDHHHHRLRDRIACHQQQFKRVVEARGVGLHVVNQREQFLQIVA